MGSVGVTGVCRARQRVWGLGRVMVVLDACEDYLMAQKPQNPRGGRAHLCTTLYHRYNDSISNNWLKCSEMTTIMIIRALS